MIRAEDRATLAVIKGIPGLDLYDENERLRATLSEFKGKLRALGLYDENGKPTSR